MQKVTNLCHFLPSCWDAKWLCRCKQHGLFAANTYHFFVRFPSFRESNCAVSVCACAENAVTALYTGWGILSKIGGDKCSDPCLCGWEGVICVKLVQPAVAPGSCTMYMNRVIGLWVPNVSMPPKSMNFAYWPTWTTRRYKLSPRAFVYRHMVAGLLLYIPWSERLFACRRKHTWGHQL
jgi:hypothetical protein